MGVYQANVEDIMSCVPENVILYEIRIFLFLKQSLQELKV